jgi:LuxR family transcriptional regulator, maltose regulon positive regulatory protein
VHLLADLPEQVATLHGRASVWFERHGSLNDAIHHAIAAQDFVRAASLIEHAIPEMRRSRQESTLLGWLQALPNELARARPVLSAHYAWVLLAQGKIDGVETWLLDAERSLDRLARGNERPEDSTSEIISAEEEELRRLPGSIAIYRAGRSLASGDIHATVGYAQQALKLAAEEDHLERGAAAALLALVAWANGDLKGASRFYPESIQRLQQAGHITDAIGCTLSLADIGIAQGRLREAMRTYKQGLQLAMAHGGLVLRGAADMYVGMSELYREQNDLEAATQHLLTSREFGEFTGLPQNRYRWRVAMARIREAQGESDSVIELLREAEHLFMSDFSPDVRPVRALLIRAHLVQGRLDEGLAWVHARGLSYGDTLCYLHEFEHITWARVLLAQYRQAQVDRTLWEATELLQRFLEAAEGAGRIGSALEILVLLALAFQMQGDRSAALDSLQRALLLAEPDGYVHLFLDEGASMAQLLREAMTRGIMPNYAGRLLQALNRIHGGIYMVQCGADVVFTLEAV